MHHPDQSSTSHGFRDEPRPARGGGEGLPRELYYRVNVIAIQLPPLRERAGDVKLLAHAFLKRYGEERVTGIEDAALQALEAYAWPGNVRELRNVVERACALADGALVTRRDLPDYLLQGAGIRGPAAAASGGPMLPASGDLALKDAKEKWEASYLRDLLERHRGNVSAAAKAAARRPEDLPPSDQQVPDPRLTPGSLPRRASVPPRLHRPIDAGPIPANTLFSFVSIPGTGVAP